MAAIRLLLMVLMVAVGCSGSPLRDPGIRPLTDLLSRMQPAHYDPAVLSTTRTSGGGGGRYRRDVETTAPPQQVQLNVTTHGRTYQLLLRRQQDLFADGAVFESTEGRLPYDVRRVYEGTLADDPDAVVRGVATRDGLFDGHVLSGDGQLLYIEPATRYVQGGHHEHHSVAHTASDVHWDKLPACTSHHLHQQEESEDDSINSVTAEEQEDFSVVTNPERNRTESNRIGTSHLSPPQHRRARRWLPDLDLELPLDGDLRRGSRKRATIISSAAVPGAVDIRKTTCMLYLQADHLFFQKYGSEESCIEVMTRHVQRVNDIYRVTDFNQDGKPDNITFMIKRIKVHTMEALKDPTYRFPMNYGVEKFLELFSEEDYDAFCLAYMFTYRDFEMGTLGLAWTGDLKNAGGVCEKNGHYRGSMKSLNTGIVTLLNYGKHVPPAVSHVTLAHEIGHNFGSPHDPESCTPSGEDGNYIMFARATSGDKKNNNKFSPCSIRSINPVLNTKARSPKGCFTEPQRSLCGNGVVEYGEQCDCGWGEDCHDACCFPQASIPPEGATPCHLTPGSRCSPSQGPCCTAACQLKFGDKCRDDNGCRDASFCSGRNSLCPPSLNKPNKTVCNEEFVCFMGECTGSICLAYGLESCQCRVGPNDKKTKACELCCKHPGENQPCLSSFEWNQYPYDVPDMYSKPGTPCNDYNGYCDVFQKCREVDPSGPLATLRKFLLSEESIASFKKWIVQYWYAVMFIIIAVILLMVAIAKLLGKRPTVKKLKQVTIVHSATTETVRLPAEGATVNHPTAVRPKLPLKRRLHEGSGAALRAAQKKKKKLGIKGKRRHKKVAATEDHKTEEKRQGKGGQVEKSQGKESIPTSPVKKAEAEENRQKSPTERPGHEAIVEKKIQQTPEVSSVSPNAATGGKSVQPRITKPTVEKEAHQRRSTSHELLAGAEGKTVVCDRRNSLQPVGRSTAPELKRQSSEQLPTGRALRTEERTRPRNCLQPEGQQTAPESKRRSLDRLPSDRVLQSEERTRPSQQARETAQELKRHSLERIPTEEEDRTRQKRLDSKRRSLERLPVHAKKHLPAQQKVDHKPQVGPEPKRHLSPGRVSPPPLPARKAVPDTAVVPPKSGDHENKTNTSETPVNPSTDVRESDAVRTEKRLAATENAPVVAIIPDRQHHAAEKRRAAADKGNRKRAKHKGEVIDYSKQRPQAPAASRGNPVGKVESWLQQQQAVPRSKSTPADLTEKSGMGRSASGPVGKPQLRLEYGGAPFKLKLHLAKASRPPRRPPAVSPELVRAAEDADSNLHTVPSDLEVLLSDSEFLFSEDGA